MAAWCPPEDTESRAPATHASRFGPHAGRLRRRTSGRVVGCAGSGGRNVADRRTDGGVDLDRAALTPVVRRALGRATAEPVDWECRPLHYPRAWQTTAGVHRVRGTARDRGERVPWRLVLKIAGAPPAGGPIHGPSVGTREPGSLNYWKREAELFRDGVLDAVRGDFAPPACYGVDEPDPETARIWLEEVDEAVGPDWPLERFVLAARHLGAFNGRYLVGAPVPAHPSFTPDYVRADLTVGRSTRAALMAPAVWAEPAVRAALPPGVVDGYARLWAEQAAFLGVLARVPRVFCHRDAFRNNLIARRLPDGREQTIALDWALSGPGHLGEDLWKLVTVTLLFMRAPCGARELDGAVFAGYLGGLRDAGWRGDARLARLGYAATAVWWVPPQVALLVLRDPAVAASVAKAVGHPVDEVRARAVELIRFGLDRADEAARLAGSVP